MKAELVDLEGGAVVRLRRAITVAGRHEQCDLRIVHSGVSKYHCVIVKAPDVLYVRDLISTNGTKVNGQRVARALLLPNDVLTIGGRDFRVLLGPDEAPDECDGENPELAADSESPDSDVE